MSEASPQELRAQLRRAESHLARLEEARKANAEDEARTTAAMSQHSVMSQVNALHALKERKLHRLEAASTPPRSDG